MCLPLSDRFRCGVDCDCDCEVSYDDADGRGEMHVYRSKGGNRNIALHQEDPV